MTILASFGGGIASLIYSLVKTKGKLEPGDLINGILGSLVAITGMIKQRYNYFFIWEIAFEF